VDGEGSGVLEMKLEKHPGSSRLEELGAKMKPVKH
jgi:hypothetical protein